MTIKGNHYPETVEVAGKRLILLGAGVRMKWFFNVYTMGAYSERGSYQADAAVSIDEIKSLRFHMLRDLSAENMSQALSRVFAKNTPQDASSELRGRIRTFLSYFRQDLAKGARMELTCQPGIGVLLKQNGLQQGAAISGKAFADILWSCYFSSRTCCSGLKKLILSGCSQRHRLPVSSAHVPSNGTNCVMGSVGEIRGARHPVDLHPSQ